MQPVMRQPFERIGSPGAILHSVVAACHLLGGAHGSNEDILLVTGAPLIQHVINGASVLLVGN